MDAREHERRWRQTHAVAEGAGGPLVVGWLRAVRLLAFPLARAGVPPTALTATGLALAAAAVPVAAVGGRWALVAALLVLLSAVCDGLDGAVAVQRKRPSRWGHVVDAGADRLSEAAHGGVLWALGAPVPAVVAAVALSWWLEYVRDRGHVAAGSVVVLTVAERPTRVIIVMMFALAAGSRVDSATTWATAGAVVWAVVGVAGVVQLVARWRAVST